MNRRLCVLIADDDKALTDEWLQLFQEEEIGCETANSPSDCLGLLKKRGPGYFQAILLDIQFPIGTEGIKLLPDIRQVDPVLPVIYVSGYTDLERLERGVRGGAQLMVPKPIPFAILLHTVYTAVIRKEAEMEQYFYSRLIVHEMKNRAFAAQAEVDQLLEVAEDRETLKGLRSIQSALDQLADRAKRILDISSPDPEVASDVKECVEWALMKLGSQPLSQDGNDAEIEEPDIASIPRNLPSVAIRDEMLIEVLCELFGNALRAMRTTGGKIQIQAGLTSAEKNRGDGVEVRIRDYGTGVPPATKLQLFDIPRLPESSPTRLHGMGLYYCRKVIENCGGWIRHQDPPDGPGAEFLFWLPSTSNV